MKQVEQKCDKEDCDNVLKMTLEDDKIYTWTCQKCGHKNTVLT